MDYQKSKRQKRILGNGKMSGTDRYIDQPGERPMAQTRVTKPREQPGERPMAQRRVPNWYNGGSSASATTQQKKTPSWYSGGSKASASVKTADNTRRQYENAFGSSQNNTEKKPSWYSGKKTKAKASVKGKNG